MRQYWSLLLVVLGTAIVFQVTIADETVASVDETNVEAPLNDDAPADGAKIVPKYNNRWKQQNQAQRFDPNDPNCQTPAPAPSGQCNRKCGCSDVAGPPGPMGGSNPGGPGPMGPKGERGPMGDRGRQGDPSPPGPPGPDGPRGPKGRRGPPGSPGNPGQVGAPGSQGKPGPRGPMGPQGQQGNPGNNGNDGQPGCDGADGKDGQKGKDGRAGPVGDKGEKGVRGPAGQTGPMGPKGPSGPKGASGSDAKGRPGYKGQKGEPGPMGPQGDDGRPGPDGDNGPQGKRGPRGDPGPKGEPGDQSCYASDTCVANFIYARHSQSTDVPPCARPSHRNLWSGWSLLHTEDEARSFVQDLGRASSCVKQFEPMPFMFCGSNEVCTWGARTATSYWLASNERASYISLFGLDDSRERPLSDINDIKRQISHCSVCVSCGPVIAVHSQNTSVPECPSGDWTSLWTGYSLAMHSVGPMGGGQPLESPGSCLENFRHHPYIECTSTGQCAYYSEKMTYWLAGLDQMPTNTVDPTRVSVVKKREEAIGNIGRCRVCSLEMTARR